MTRLKLAALCLLSAVFCNALMAAAQLEKAINALHYLATQCEKDIDTFCSDVEIGDGKILNCLTSQGDKLSAECKQAMEDVEK